VLDAKDFTPHEALDKVKELRAGWDACIGALYKNVAVGLMQDFLETCIAKWGRKFMDCVSYERDLEICGEKFMTRNGKDKRRRDLVFPNNEDVGLVEEAEQRLSDKEIRDYLDGFIAWDHGARDSGIKDDKRRAEIRETLRKLANEPKPTAFRKLVWPILFRSGPNGPYGIEDVQEALNWLRDFIGWDDWSGL